jgi:hypothetical protein
MSQFISEDDLKTFEGWLKYQAIDPSALKPDELAPWRAIFDEISKSPAPKVGLMKLRSVPDEHLYAVAVREGSDLWLTLWVRRSRTGVYIIVPRADRGWDPHTSYHVDGTFHMKSFGHKFGPPQKRQPLTSAFRGTEQLGVYAGHGPKAVGAICDPAVFSGVVEVQPGVLGPRDGAVVVDLVEPHVEPMPRPVPSGEVVRQATFKDGLPWVVLRVVSTPSPSAAASSTTKRWIVVAAIAAFVAAVAGLIAAWPVLKEWLAR